MVRNGLARKNGWMGNKYVENKIKDNQTNLPTNLRD